MKFVRIAVLYTLVTAVMFGIAYPLAITGIAQVVFRNKANGQLIVRNGDTVGSVLIGQPFTGRGYFHSRPSAAGSGYDASASSGFNYGPASKALVDRVDATIKAEGSGAPVPVDLVTASGSGLDPDISPAAAMYQAERVAKVRGLPLQEVQSLITEHTVHRQLGLLGEPRVNVLALNLALSQRAH